MTRAFRFSMLFVVAFALFVQASAALAAPVGWDSLNVTLHSDQQQSLLLVSGELPAGAQLPYQTELAVPAGTQLQWIGEILGDDPSKDSELKYAKTSSNGMDVYQFTMTKSRIAQVEGVVPNPATFDGTNYTSAFKWTAWQAVPEVRISQRIPRGAQILQAAAGASVQPGATGYDYYTKTVAAPKAGDVLDLSFSYAPPGAGATTPATSPQSGSSAIALTLIMVVALAGFALFFVKVQKKMAVRAALSEPATTTQSGSAERATHSAPKRGKKREVEPEPAVVPAPAKRVNPAVPAIIVVGLILGAFIMAGSKGTSPAILDNVMSRNFGAASACQTASLGFTPNEGVDIARQGGKLLESFEGMEGVGEVTIDLAQSRIEMGWCESSQSEESMREVLTATGLITLGQSAPVADSVPASATVAASGKLQTTSVDTTGGTFSPSQIVLKAGVPSEIAFGQAEGCLTEVVFKDLGITQDLTKGAATVKLPGLDAGTYAFACAMGHQGGQIVVQ